MLRYLEIKESLKEIIYGMNVGERLQDRVTLCQILDTSRTTLDKAIRELTDEGMLSSRQGSGTFVANTHFAKQDTSYIWGVIVPNITEPIYNVLVSSIESVAQKKNINVVLCSSENDKHRQAQFIRRLTKSHAAGFIIVPVISNNPIENQSLYLNLKSQDIPFVFCNRSVEGINAPIVQSNDFYGGYIATKHLISRGYRRIAYISVARYKTCIDRYQGYAAAIMESGLELDRSIIRIPSGREPDFIYYDETRKLLATTDIDAVFAFGDYGAFSVAAAIKDAGLVVSDDIGLIGYNDIEACNMSVPPLSSVSYKAREIGIKAAELLYALIYKPDSLQGVDIYTSLPELVVRESSRGKRKR